MSWAELLSVRVWRALRETDALSDSVGVTNVSCDEHGAHVIYPRQSICTAPCQAQICRQDPHPVIRSEIRPMRLVIDCFCCVACIRRTGCGISYNTDVMLLSPTCALNRSTVCLPPVVEFQRYLISCQAMASSSARSHCQSSEAVLAVITSGLAHAFLPHPSPTCSSAWTRRPAWA